MVERNLAKVEVASSSLVSRSRHCIRFTKPGAAKKGSSGFPFLSQHLRRDSKAVMQRIANPSSPVRLRIAPPLLLCQVESKAVGRARAGKGADATGIATKAGTFLGYNFEFHAGIAQLVERNLAKVEVASSSLVSRSRHCIRFTKPGAAKKGSSGFPFLSQHLRRDSKAVMQRIANPSSPVRLRIAPPPSPWLFDRTRDLSGQARVRGCAPEIVRRRRQRRCEAPRQGLSATMHVWPRW